jgi:hypothetical protein
MTIIGDVVLIYRDELPGFFAQIQDVSPDQKRDWYQVTLLVLQIPLTEVIWILREEYINGEAFTMNSDRVRIEKVTGGRLSDSDTMGEGTSRDDKVIPIFDRKRR